MDRFTLMLSFTRAVETGSFTAVAREMGVGQPAVSRNIAALEKHLGARLMQRSTRKLSLTPEGERFYQEARAVLDGLNEAEANARGEDRPSGLVRVACATSLGSQVILPWFGELLERYTELEMDLQIGDQYVDLIGEGVDIAIRIGTLRDSAMRARRIGSSVRVCVASAGYLEKWGEPKVPHDLKDHACIVYTLLTTGAWSFRSGDIAVTGRLKVNSIDAVYRAVHDGLGIGYGPYWLFEDAIRDGSVRVVLADHLGEPTPINILYSAKRLLPRRVSMVMDFIAEKFSNEPALNAPQFRENTAGGKTVGA